MNPGQNNNLKKWIHLALGAGLVIVFFLPWVSWKEEVIHGYYLPAGKFFTISESSFGLGNPYPQLSFTFYAFWLIPLFIIWVFAGTWQHKKTTFPAFAAGALT